MVKESLNTGRIKVPVEKKVRTKEDSFDKGMSARRVYVPTKGDLIPLVLMIALTCICLASSLASYYLVRDNTTTQAKDQLKTTGNRSTIILQRQINSTVDLVSSVSAMFSVLNGRVNQKDQFIPFVYANDNAFPQGINRIYFVERVANAEVPEFLARTRAQGGIFANYTMYNRDDAGVQIPVNPKQAVYFPVTLVAPFDSSVTLLGLDHYSDPFRIPFMNAAIKSGEIVATTQFDVGVNANDTINGVVMYCPAYSSFNTSKLLGFVVPVFETSYLFNATLTRFQDDVGISVSDITPKIDNTTAVGSGFMYSTRQQISNDSLPITTARQNARMLASIPYTAESSLTFGDRKWNITYIPTDSFINGYNSSILKYVGIIVSTIAWLLGVGACLFLLCYRRLRSSLRAKQKSEVRVRILSKFLPGNFLKLIRCKLIVNLAPMFHRSCRLALMNVSIDNLNELNLDNTKNPDQIMSVMNELYIRIKMTLRKSEGFIHRCEGLGFTVVIPNESKALNIALSMQDSVQDGIKVKVAVHCANVVSGILGDASTMATALITDQADVLKKLAMMRCPNTRKVIVSGDLLDCLKKTTSKNFTYMGRVETLTLINKKKTYVDAYHFVDDESDTSKPAARKTYGSAMKKFAKKDYLGAHDMLQALVESD
ncbi:signal peptidase complex catalytic subunit SEC11, partial [Acrasis kona]